jgi:hypothetical protein
MTAPPWSALRRFGESRLLRTSWLWIVVVPFAARAASVLDMLIVALLRDLYGRLYPNQALHITPPGLPVSWQLFYFAAVATTIATVCYNIGAPEIVRLFPTYADFVKDGRGADQLKKYLQLLLHAESKRLGINAGKTVGTFVKRYCTSVEGADQESLAALQHSPLKTEGLGDAFWFVYDLADASRPRLRYLAAFFYVTAAVLIGGVMIRNAVFVLTFVAR